MQRGDLDFAIRGDFLQIRALEYGACEVFLSEADLSELGLVTLGGGWPPSRAAVKLERPRYREPLGPAILDPNWREPKGLRCGDFRIVPVNGGVDVYVDEFDPLPALLPLGKLAASSIVQRARASA